MIVTVWKERKSGRVEMANVFMLTGFAMATMTATIKKTKKNVVRAKHFFRKLNILVVTCAYLNF